VNQQPLIHLFSDRPVLTLGDTKLAPPAFTVGTPASSDGKTYVACPWGGGPLALAPDAPFRVLAKYPQLTEEGLPKVIREIAARLPTFHVYTFRMRITNRGHELIPETLQEAFPRSKPLPSYPLDF
jgi:hypothetical protein